MEDTDTGTVELELAVRTLAPSGGQGRQSEVLRRLRRLEREGTIDELSVTVWGKRVGLTTPGAETDHAQSVLETVESFRSWADDHGVSVDRYFETREVDSAFTGERYTALELPSMALAEYRDGDLHWVSPCIDDGVAYTVDDRIETLESMETGGLDRSTEPAAPRIAEE